MMRSLALCNACSERKSFGIIEWPKVEKGRLISETASYRITFVWLLVHQKADRCLDRKVVGPA